MGHKPPKPQRPIGDDEEYVRRIEESQAAVWQARPWEMGEKKWAMKKIPGWLFDIGDEKLPKYIGFIGISNKPL